MDSNCVLCENVKIKDVSEITDTGSIIPPPHTGGWIVGAMKPVSLLISISNLAHPCLLSARKHYLPQLFESQLFKLPVWHALFARLCCAQARSFSCVSD